MSEPLIRSKKIFINEVLAYLSFYRNKGTHDNLHNIVRTVFEPPMFNGTCIFKSHSFPNVWSVLVEFCSVSSKGS